MNLMPPLRPLVRPALLTVAILAVFSTMPWPVSVPWLEGGHDSSADTAGGFLALRRPVGLSPVAFAQSKRPLTLADYDNWRSIVSRGISRDGKYVAYAEMPAVGDGEVVVREIATGKEVRLPVGALPVRDSSEEEGEEQGPPVVRGPRLQFSPDNKWLAVGTFPTKSALAQARKEKKKPEEMPKNGLILLELASGKQRSFSAIRSVAFPEEASNVIALHSESRQPAPARGSAAARKPTGTDLLLLSLSAEAWERTFPNVTEYSFADDGKHLAYTVGTKDEAGNGANVVATTPGAAPLVLASGKMKFSNLKWDEPNRHLAFVAGPQLQGWVRGEAAAKVWVTPNEGEQVSDRAGLAFAKRGPRLFFSFTKAVKEIEATPATSAEEKAVFEMWHWKDDRVQTIQKRRAEQDRNRSFRAVYHLPEAKVVRLASPALPEITPSEDGLLALGFDDRAYRPQVEYDGRMADVYLVQTGTGDRTRILNRFSGSVSLSPDAKYGVYFQDKHWYLLNTATSTSTRITANVMMEGRPVFFHNEEHDTPNAATAYGQAGWTKDSRQFLLYDRYDVWSVEAATGKLTNLTAGAGRASGITYRVAVARRRADDRFLDPAEPLLLRAEKEQTRQTGFFEGSIQTAMAPRQLRWDSRNWGQPERARDAAVLLLTAEKFDQAPDLYVTSPTFAQVQAVSNLQRQVESFAWGTAELMNFTNSDGVALQGMLVKPAGFDPNKKYPMLVYIYERLSNTVNSFRTPNPTNSINASLAMYASQGYVVLLPDIAYTIGYPGESAYKCVMPAVQRVVDMGFVDNNRIGIQGHSWGGYQIAYLVTRTNRFRAAAPGALVANMFSAYDGIRYGTGLPRQFQYEKTQSRIGGSIWQYPLRFLENSPLFMADRVQTPLLMMHNDADDAVPFTQGIEFYLALRRLNKEIYFFNYNGEPHNLRKRANRKDYSMRLFQFFNHFLKDERAPEWIKSGIPYLERELPSQQAMPPVSDEETATEPHQLP